ncbi:MAG: MotA/TolQ/ExbB proton channel family protein [bacterium]|nr:MotA/TolQ/ExbB proton channel family protein [bacterium]
MELKDLLELLHQGRLTVYPLGILSVIVIGIAIERFWRYRGLARTTRDLTRKLVDSLVRHDLSAARTLCEASSTPMAEVFGEGLRWRNIALEDLNEVLSTARNEVVTELRRGLWFIGTIGSLSPYIGLLGTVVGIMVAFGAIASSGDAGFEVVSAGISEALIATAVGLLVAIVSLALFNFLQVRVNNISSTFTRASERFVQALLFVEAGTNDSANDQEGKPSHGALSPARG